MEGGKPPTPPHVSPSASMEARLGSEADAWPSMNQPPGGIGSRSFSRSSSDRRMQHAMGSAGAGGPSGGSPGGGMGGGHHHHHHHHQHHHRPAKPAAGPSVDMEPLVSVLNRGAAGEEGAERVREAAGTIRSSLKNNPENKARLLAAGGIDALVGVLASPSCRDGTTVEHCVTALLNMSLTEGVEPLITSAGGIEAIVHVLTSEGSSAAARENAAAALFTLSGPAENKVRVQEAGAIAGLVTLLQGGSLRGRKDAALALFNLALEERCVPEIVARGTVRVLVGLLGSEASDTGMEDKVMAVVANLCKFAEGRAAVHREGGIAAMVDVIDGGSARAKEDAAVSLHLMATHNQASFQLILEEGAMPALVKLAQSGTSRAKAKAKALLELLRSHTSANSGSFKGSSAAYSQSFGTLPPTTTGELRGRVNDVTGELR